MLSQRPLGRSGIDVTVLGLGTFALGGTEWSYSWGAQSDEDSIATIRRAVEAGINWIDTAAVYGRGHSEDVVRRALAPFAESDRPYVFTKCGLVWNAADSIDESERRVGNPESLRQELEGSLRRLGVDTIDLYQMHWPPEDGTEIEEYWAALVRLREQGKVRAIGLSNHSVDQLERAEAIGHVDSLQPKFSAIDRGAAADVIPWCQAHGTGVIVYSPLQSGLLTGAFSPQRVGALAPNDWRARHVDFQDPRLSANLRVADAFAVVAARHSVTAAAAALSWTLGFEGVSAAIVGGRRSGQLDEWLRAAPDLLEQEDYQWIAQAIDRAGAGAGPTMPSTI